jgi:hypothetical protein
MTGIEPSSLVHFVTAGGRPLNWVGRPWVRLAWADCLEQMGQLLEVQAGPRPRPASRRITQQKVFCAGPALERAIDTGDAFNSGLGVAELAVALRRYRLEHGQYPDTLSGLVPAYVASVPIDPLNGEPPVYQRQGAGFRLQAAQSQAKIVSSQTAALLDWNVPR